MTHVLIHRMVPGLFRNTTWVAQSVKCLTLAQVMISQLVSLSPMMGSVLTAQSLEPASDSCLPLSAPPLLMLCLSLKNKFSKTLKKCLGVALLVDK